jgi:hypothetical protein
MNTPYNTYRTVYTFSYNDIIAFSFKPDGSIDWHTVLRKKQLSEDDGGITHLLLSSMKKTKYTFSISMRSAHQLHSMSINYQAKVLQREWYYSVRRIRTYT